MSSFCYPWVTPFLSPVRARPPACQAASAPAWAWHVPCTTPRSSSGGRAAHVRVQLQVGEEQQPVGSRLAAG